MVSIFIKVFQTYHMFKTSTTLTSTDAKIHTDTCNPGLPKIKTAKQRTLTKNRKPGKIGVFQCRNQRRHQQTQRTLVKTTSKCTDAITVCVPSVSVSSRSICIIRWFPSRFQQGFEHVSCIYTWWLYSVCSDRCSFDVVSCRFHGELM